MDITVRDMSNDTLIITISSAEIDIDNAKMIKDRLYEIAVNSDKNIVLDLSYVSHIDSSGLGVLIVLQNLMNQKGKMVSMKNVNHNILEMMKSGNLDALFHLG